MISRKKFWDIDNFFCKLNWRIMILQAKRNMPYIACSYIPFNDICHRMKDLLNGIALASKKI